MRRTIGRNFRETILEPYVREAIRNIISGYEVKALYSEQSRKEIADKIAGSKRQGEFKKYIEKLRAEAIIDWKNDEIKKAYEVGLKQGIGNRDQGLGSH